MSRRPLGLGEAGEIAVTPEAQSEGKWRRVDKPQQAKRWTAQAYVRVWTGERKRLTARAAKRGEAEALLRAKISQALNGSGSQALTASSPLTTAAELWLTRIKRPDSGLSTRSVSDYTKAYRRYVDTSGSSIRGLTLGQANNPQRLRTFLESVADSHGTGAAHVVKNVLSGILRAAVQDGALEANAMRSVDKVTASTPRPSKRDRTRALTDEERATLLSNVDALAADPIQHPGTRAKRQATGDLIAYMLGTGVRITEGRTLRWEDTDLEARTVRVRGTKSKASDRTLTLPAWVLERLRRRQAQAPGGGRTGYVFHAPRRQDGEAVWDQSNCAGALREALDGAGLEWAIPHSLRRTVASRLHAADIPLVRIADQMGHSDPSMTARVYLGRSAHGDKDDIAAAL